MIFTIAGPITFAVIFVFFLVVWLEPGYHSDPSKRWFKTISLALILAIVWPFLVMWQQYEWNYEEQVKQEKKEYYDRCIVEVENKVNDKVQFYSKTDKCVK